VYTYSVRLFGAESEKLDAMSLRSWHSSSAPSSMEPNIERDNSGSMNPGALNQGARYGIRCLEWLGVGLVSPRSKIRQKIHEGQPLNTNFVKEEHQLQKTKPSKMTLNNY
jgi:hypothetical protein